MFSKCVRICGSVNTRRFFALGLSALLSLANIAYAGSYQRTKDGKTLVWNDQPKPGDAATWSGARDADGYATGDGTLTWFAANKVFLTGSHMSSVKYVPVARYSGKMVHGKFEGHTAKADTNRKTSRGKVAKVTKSDGGNPPKKPTFRHGVAAPSDEAPPAQKSSAPTPAPAVTATPVPANDTLHSLANPPSSLELTPAAEASPQASSIASPSVSPSAPPPQ